MSMHNFTKTPADDIPDHFLRAELTLERSLARDQMARLTKERDDLREALRVIAFEPIGPIDASHSDMVEGMTAIAKRALANLNKTDGE